MAGRLFESDCCSSRSPMPIFLFLLMAFSVQFITPIFGKFFAGQVYIWGDMDAPLPGVSGGGTHLRIWQMSGFSPDAPPTYDATSQQNAPPPYPATGEICSFSAHFWIGLCQICLRAFANFHQLIWCCRLWLSGNVVLKFSEKTSFWDILAWSWTVHFLYD